MSDERSKEESGRGRRRARALARTASVFFILVSLSFVSLLVDNFHLGFLSLRCGLFAQSLEDIDMGVSHRLTFVRLLLSKSGEQQDRKNQGVTMVCFFLARFRS